MAKNVTIAGASYPSVPSIILPQTGGGNASFFDVSDTTATASDVASGKLFYSALGVLTMGTSAGSGLTFETGSYTPTEDIAQLTIQYANTHNAAPFMVFFADADGTISSTTNSNHLWGYVDYFKLWGVGVPYSTTAYRYAHVFYSYRSSTTSSLTSGTTQCQYNSNNTGSSNVNYPRYWVTNTQFRPYSNSTSRYWRANRVYKWVAVWWN